ncbi:hypothetical protein [Changpingibacter yushuensis]|uniref:hypothetical protein n=1 Tax=Changpingibacter yushuensis TaxID=2758440 RepID=UPI0015F5DE9D|nr:hypothetical protein [Changpingibacter yushuensis]
MTAPDENQEGNPQLPFGQQGDGQPSVPQESGQTEQFPTGQSYPAGQPYPPNGQSQPPIDDTQRSGFFNYPSMTDSGQQSAFTRGPFDQGNFQHSNGSGMKPPSRAPLNFMIFAGFVLVIVIMGIFIFRVFRMGQEIATSDNSDSTSSLSTPATDSSGDAEETTTVDQVAEARAAVVALSTDPTCTNVSDATTPIIALASVSNESSDSTVITDALAALSEKCGADFTIELQDGLTTDSAPTSLRTLASDTSWWYLQKAAPEDAVSVQDFTTQANNIRCVFGDDDVACSIYVYDYVSPTGCEGRTATYTLGRTGDVLADCESELNATTVLDYGTTVEYNGFACTLDQTTGIECWSELSGHGFQLRRAAGTTY